MALSVVRRGMTSLRGVSRHCVAAPVPVLRPQIATIVSKALRDQDYKRPAPFPYKTDKYGFFAALLDKTTHRFDENSKVIVVDGPIAAGKTEFAKEIADELDMLYVPHANMDMLYINPYGYDMRQLDSQLPDSVKSFDEKNFLQNPKDPNAAGFQFHMFRLRLVQYIDALAHVLSTGQGVVMDRSVYSDFVFIDAMANFGYISKPARNLYYECKAMTVPELMRPHLVVYLDMPVDVVLQRIQERNLPHEVNSPVLTREFLSYMEQVYKKQFLNEMSGHSELLVYDWSEKGDCEVVVEDIERLNFEFDKNDPKMADWKLTDEWDWCKQRMLFTKNKDKILMWMNVPGFSVPELVVNAEDHKVFEDVWWNAPGMKYAEGFNADMGDQFIVTKTRVGT
ncbi:NADH dehydrogenase [ubiquinone] 1 alpha subcomplex subunit 10, mitochondrial-like [Homarus americanus]|uniref:NADH dehydrogenase [ubiquinone] 1 alpha subcomplex subunit 10, mitochondrial-like n=1 Tax=Homarus americanus TaxID=6706 RepID=UPI001C4925C4|nr:NADH dehydrogenase [ubiquinone] 1 alpha subcomplex subunit 10, mitochondrial-like [Homarus americanus]